MKTTMMRTVSLLGMAVCMSAALPVFAESAPVYDADTMQQQFENSGDQGQDLPPPPPPGQERAYVPAQAPAAAAQQDEVPVIAPPPRPEVPNLSTGQRISRLEQQIDNLQNNTSASRLETLQTEIQTLRGQVEQLTHQLQTMQSQQKTMYSDLDKRVSQQNTSISKAKNIAADTAMSDDEIVAPKLRKTAAKAAADTDVDAEPQMNVAEEQQIYQTAYSLIKSKKYAEAVSSLQGMLQKYPTGQFASNAHYWLGELYGLMGKNEQALSEFSTVVKDYPDSPRISDAQLKVGLIYASQTKWSDAKNAFKKVINKYPGTASSRLASEQLKQLKEAGH